MTTLVLLKPGDVLLVDVDADALGHITPEFTSALKAVFPDNRLVLVDRSSMPGMRVFEPVELDGETLYRLGEEITFTDPPIRRGVADRLDDLDFLAAHDRITPAEYLGLLEAELTGTLTTDERDDVEQRIAALAGSTP
jgi:hypothetical protein